MLPEQIDLPRPEDFCRNKLRSYNKKRCCFLGWRIALFPNLNDREYKAFERHATNIAQEMGLPGKEYGTSIPSYNDNTNTSTETLAEWFAKTVERMGYDIG